MEMFVDLGRTWFSVNELTTSDIDILLNWMGSSVDIETFSKENYRKIFELFSEKETYPIRHESWIDISTNLQHHPA